MSVHEGHRGRLKEKLRKNGTDAFLAHELLEFLLFYAIPYRDTNPTAHRLIDRAGNLEGVFSLDPRDVASVDGCGDHVGAYVALLREVLLRAQSGEKEQPIYDTHEALAALALQTASEEQEERTYLLMFDNQYRLLSTLPIYLGYYGTPDFRPALAAEPALRTGASMVLLVSVHANRGARPDEGERYTSRRIRQALSYVGVKLLDHMIVSGPIVTSALSLDVARMGGSFSYNRFCNETAESHEEDPV